MKTRTSKAEKILWRVVDYLFRCQMAAQYLGFSNLMQSYNDARLFTQGMAAHLENQRKGFCGVIHV
jgi:hypothetical protein